MCEPAKGPTLAMLIEMLAVMVGAIHFFEVVYTTMNIHAHRKEDLVGEKIVS
jgi:hypothetical protein